jgi:hypothetical protein
MARLPPANVVERQVLALPAVQARIAEIAKQVETEARSIAARRALEDGTYAALIRAQPVNPATGSALVVAADRKSKWLEEGTGIYGPERRPIKPKRGKFLVFEVKDKQGGAPPVLRTAGGSLVGRRQPAKPGDLIFAKQVRGRPASWVMRDAAAAVAASLRGARFINRRPFQG